MKIQFASIILFLLASAFFSASETAFTSLSFLQVRALETDKKKSSQMAAKLAKSPDILLTTVLIGNNIVNIGASAFTTTLTISMWGSRAVGISAGVLTFLILVFGEISPKQLAISYNTKFARMAAYPIKVLSIILYPVIVVTRFIGSLTTRFFTSEDKRTLSLESLMHVVDIAETEGIVDEFEGALFQRVVHFSEAPVKSIMTHRTDIFSLEESTLIKDVFGKIVASGFSRIPVYKEDSENIIGILLLRDILQYKTRGFENRTVGDFIHKPIFVPQGKKLNDMALQFQQEMLQIAVVLDEYGGLLGIVTMEDIVEQLFGEIYDEHETDLAMRIQVDRNNSYLIKADTTMQEIKDELDLEIERNDLARTLASFLIEELGMIPTVGQIIPFDFGNFEIVSMKDKRINLVRLVIKQLQQEN